MSGANGCATSGVDLSRLAPIIRWSAARGIADGRASAPFWAGYEAAPKNVQLAYEQGRLWACNMLAAGVAIPSWRGDPAGTAAVLKAARKAARLTGNSFPDSTL